MAHKEAPQLDTLLEKYFATLAASPALETLKRSAANWHFYAAVTGSAVAMATNASAGVIYSNTAVPVGPVANVGPGATIDTSAKVHLKTAGGGPNGISFRVGLFQSGANESGSALVRDSTAAKLLFLIPSGSNKLKKLASGTMISTNLKGVWEGGVAPLATQTATANGSHINHGWPAGNQTGFAAFRFTTASKGFDFGWVRLKYTLGSNGLANAVTAVDYAYDDTGASILAGQTTSATPEPSTAALALLAAGAAGVMALRRRRQTAVRPADEVA
jgi:hypothetical protein